MPLTAADANLIINGSFEMPDVTRGTFLIFSSGIPGWTTSFGSGIEIQDHRAGSPFAGDQHVELDSSANSGMLQQIPTVGGRTYTLSFAYSPRPGVASDSNIIEVFFDNVLLTTITASGIGLSDTSWSVFTFNVTATGSLSPLEFRAAGVSDGLGGYLDDVGLTASTATPVPEPSALLLLASGLVALGGLRSQGRRAGQVLSHAEQAEGTKTEGATRPQSRC